MSQSTNRINRIIIIFLLLAVIMSVEASAISPISASSYTYHSGYSSKLAVASKASYVANRVICGTDLNTKSLNLPEDIFVKNNKIYLLDSGNGRILVMDKAYNLVNIINEVKYNQSALDITGSKGLFVNNDENIWIADTNNKRILQIDSKGNAERILSLPKSNLLPEEFEFIPIAVCQDEKGFLYCLSDGSYYGALIFDQNNDFKGFYGANKVKATVGDAFDKMLNAFFSSENKRAYSQQKLPFQFTDIIIDNKDFIYTLTSLTSSQSTNFGQIRRLSPGGDNILYYQEDLSSSTSDNYNFGDDGYYTDDSGKKIIQNFTGIALSDDNFIFAVDSTYGKVFVYDENCVPITIFGGGLGRGDHLGTFVMPEAVAVNGSDVLVLDNQTNSLTVFERTEYGKALFSAITLTNSAQYEKSGPFWRQVVEQDQNCQMAYKGLAKEALVNGEYETSLKYAKLGRDQQTYAQAYKEVRNTFITNHFLVIFCLGILIIGSLVALVLYTTKKKTILISNAKLRTYSRTIFHPFETMDKIKYKNMGSVFIALITLILYYFLRINWSLNAGFMHNIPDPYSFNAAYILFGTLGVVLLWTVVNWGVSILFEGKAKISQIFIVVCYSLIPMLIYEAVAFICSFIILPEEAVALTILSVVSGIITAVLLLVGTMTIQEFNFTKTVGTVILSVLGILLSVFIIFMVLILFQNFMSFIGTIFYEISFR